MQKTVKFKSGNDTCVGFLTIPDGVKGPVPIQVMAGGWCYTKEIVMPEYAKPFHEIGIATLIFDYRNFGESTGEPRQHIDPWAQIEDYKNAISYVETLPEIDKDRIGIWGISYSGGHVLVVAATDSRAKWAISTIPVVNGYESMLRLHGVARFAMLQKLILEDRRAQLKPGSKLGTMPMSAMTLDELSTWPASLVTQVFVGFKNSVAPNHEHWNTIASTDNLLAYNVLPYCRRIVDTPVMMAVAKGDNITSDDWEIEAFHAILSPNKHCAVVAGVSHMSIYQNVDHLKIVATKQRNWLKATLAEFPEDLRPVENLHAKVS